MPVDDGVPRDPSVVPCTINTVGRAGTGTCPGDGGFIHNGRRATADLVCRAAMAGLIPAIATAARLRGFAPGNSPYPQVPA
jgi:hypothetical protein